jgi:hypothetical protein
MPQGSKRSGLAQPAGSKRHERIGRYGQVDDQLAQILLSLARLLLRHGYGHERIARLTKIAFVDAARLIATKLNARASIARIAALTGLTRVEVSKILKSDRSSLLRRDQLNRACRVAVGWQTDKAYLDRKGRARPLPFSAARNGFANLVKKYSGDIPARAMLAEMTRLGLVSRSKAKTILLLRNAPALPHSAVSSIEAITPWMSFIAEAGASLPSPEIASQAQQIKIHFNSLSEVIAAARELDARQRSFVAGIQQLSTRSNRSGDYEVTVSVAVATATPSRSVRKKNRKP